MHDKPQTDANRAEEPFCRQRAFVVLPPPADEHGENAEVGQRIQDEDQPCPDGCD